MMKRLIFLPLLLWMSIGGFAQGVDFREITMAEAFAAAEAEGKLVFLDCYTSWCGPCKEMANKEFPKKEAGDYFNPRFVNVKFNIEKGEGIEIAKRYNVKTVPTFLMLRPDGEVAHTIVGSSDIQTFMDKIKTFFGEETRMEQLDREFAAGQMTNLQVLGYVQALAGARRMKEAQQAGNDLLGRLSDEEKTSREFWMLMSGEVAYCAPEECFRFILENRDTYNRTVGTEAVDAFFFGRYSGELMGYIYGNPSEEWWKKFDALREKFAAIPFAKKELLDKKADFAQAKREKNVDRAIGFMAEFPALYEEKEIFMLMTAMEFALDIATKEQLRRFVALEDKYLAACLEERKPYMVALFAPYKRMAAVGVSWERDTAWKALSLEAKIENRPLFALLGNPSDKACRKMERVFSAEKTGDFFNRNFVCVRGDGTETGAPEWMGRNARKGQPVYLLLDADGEVRFRSDGVKDADELMAAFSAALQDYRAAEEQKRRR